MKYERLNKTELRIMLEVHRNAVAELELIERRDGGCSGCEHSDKGSPAACSKYGGAIPPDEVQRAGCDEWSWDSIPFN